MGEGGISSPFNVDPRVRTQAVRFWWKMALYHLTWPTSLFLVHLLFLDLRFDIL